MRIDESEIITDFDVMEKDSIIQYNQEEVFEMNNEEGVQNES